MKILLTNDDGIDAPGLVKLAPFLHDRGHEVLICAPATGRSGQSMSLTIDKPVTVTRCPVAHSTESYMVHGSTVDCVKIALQALPAFQGTELVISGMNKGFNVGHDLYYSSTVGGALEGCFLGLPAVALSRESGKEPSFSDDQALNVLDQVFPQIMNQLDQYMSNTFINVNIPAGSGGPAIFTGVSSSGLYQTCYHQQENTYMIHGDLNRSLEKGTDLGTVLQGKVSISRIKNCFIHTDQSGEKRNAASG